MSNNKSGNQIDVKREEFRKYLEKEGVLQSLTSVLVSLYEEPEKPSDALTYLKNNFAGGRAAIDDNEIIQLKEENSKLKAKVEELEKKYADLGQEYEDFKLKSSTKTSVADVVTEDKLPSSSGDKKDEVNDSKNTTNEAKEGEKSDNEAMEVENSAAPSKEAANKTVESSDAMEASDKPSEEATATSEEPKTN